MKPPSRALLEVGFLFGLLGFGYAAAWAAFRPDGLPQPVTALVPVRRDTFGALSLAVSAACAFGLQIGTGRILERRPRRTGVLDAALRTVGIYALVVWAYLCVNSLTHPYTTALRLTHFSASPAEGTTATGCFLAAAAALLALRWRELRAAGGAR